MAKDDPKPRPLTPVQQSQLKALLAQHDAFERHLRESPSVAAEREHRRAEEARLVRERDALAAKERRAARNLRALQNRLSDLTEELSATAFRNAKGDMRRVTRAQQWLAQINVEGLNKVKLIDPDAFAEAITVIFSALFFPEPTAEQSPEQSEAERNAERAKLAMDICNAARKARSEPLLTESEFKLIPFSKIKKET